MNRTETVLVVLGSVLFVGLFMVYFVHVAFLCGGGRH